MRRSWVAGILLTALFVVSGCAPDRVATAPPPNPSPPSVTSTETSAAQAPSAEVPPVEALPASIAWLDTPLTDAVTGKRFRLSDYKGKPVLLHAFAAW